MRQPARERLFLTAAGAAVAAALLVGLLRLGPPTRQRKFEADAKRVQDLHQIAQWIQLQRYPPDSGNPLPASLFELQRRATHLQTKDPATSQPYEYRTKNDWEYELCAVFETDSKDSLDQPQPGAPPSFWNHPPGRHCFQLDARRETPLYQR